MGLWCNGYICIFLKCTYKYNQETELIREGSSFNIGNTKKFEKAVTRPARIREVLGSNLDWTINYSITIFSIIFYSFQAPGYAETRHGC